jgi:biopolymer transport protein ExbB/TolQ
MQINLIELWSNMGLPVKGVVLLLTAQAIGCIVVIIDRFRLLRTSKQRAEQFVALVQPSMDAGDYGAVLSQVEQVPPNHLSSFLETALRSFSEGVQVSQDHKEAAVFARRALDRKGEQITRDIRKGMNILASTGSTAPFVGLLGTVLGIINAFKMIAESGSGGIGTIGAAIGEALVVTGYGLMVAIPSVLIFNWLSGRIAAYESGMLNAGSELVDRLELAYHQQITTAKTDAQAGPSVAPSRISSRPVAR